jgi:trans-aconitate 2-methyltransferase
VSEPPGSAGIQSTRWDPGRYLEFAEHRSRPALDLLARVEADPGEVWDLGCGTGHVTAQLRDRWPKAAVHGLDSSPDMLAVARRIAGIDWVEGDISAWDPPVAPDLAVSNAVLQWVGEHGSLFPMLIERVADGGVLAVQMPRNHDAPSHSLLAETARSARWRGRMGNLARRAPVEDPAFYHDVLAPITRRLDIWETEYLHVLHGPDPVARWSRSTAARPYLEAAGDQADDFMTEYAERLRVAYPQRDDGTTLLMFRRLFIVARK